MTVKTEQKIMDAALKIFAKEGYKSSTTKAIAEESGFTEMTLFRKFKTKRNLYNKVLTQNVEKMIEDYKESVFTNEKFENTRDFIEDYVKNTLKISYKNFEIFYLSVNEENRLIEPIMADTANITGKYLKEHISNKKIDYRTLAITINSFLYVVNLERYHGRNSSFGRPIKDVIESFIDLVNCMVEDK
jgi:TetR/AcrR family transcriptional regulator